MCPDCEARRKMAREALMKSAFGDAALQVIKGTAEMLGLKQKTGADELEAQGKEVDPVDPPEPEKRKTKTSGVSG